jgi:8-oxo-dGTP pyrophosphatase MutT (NUDIX family)
MISLQRLVPLLKNRLQQPLPGDSAHNLLRARPSGSVIPNFTHKLPPKPGSVLIAFYEENGQVRFPLIKRPEYPGAHSGQVSLPGGKAEDGEDEIETALREGFEEVGIPSLRIEVIGTLSKFFVIPSNFMVTPVVGFVKGSPEFKADEHEVERILQADLAALVQPDAIREKEILAAGRFAMLAPHFEVENEIVWGATAMILNELRTIVLEIK